MFSVIAKTDRSHVMMSSKQPTTKNEPTKNTSKNSDKSTEERSNQFKDQGNECFKSGEFLEAIQFYTKSIQSKPSSIAYANRAMAYLKLEDYIQAEKDSTQSIRLDASYVKAYLRRGAARKATDNLDGAISDYEMALRYEPMNKNAEEERKLCIDAWMKEKKLTMLVTETIPISTCHIAPSDRTRSLKAPRTAQGTAKIQPIMVDNDEIPELETDEVDSQIGTNDGKEGTPVFEEINTRHGEISTMTTTMTVVDNGVFLQNSSNTSLKANKKKALHAPPKSGVEFEKGWRECKGNMSRYASYLKEIRPDRLPVLLKQALTPTMLAEILHAVLGPLLMDNSQQKLVGDVLTVLPDVPRFQMNLLSLSAHQKRELKAAWDTSGVEKRLMSDDGGALLLEKIAAQYGTMFSPSSSD